MIEALLEKLKRREEIEAIALAGSRTTKQADPFSDYDLYIYLKSPLDMSVRREILEPLSDRLEINNTFWEMEDNGIFKNGIPYDLVYRNIDEFENSLEGLLHENRIGNAYNTCLWNNLQNSQILYDPDGKLKRLRERYSMDYPEKLRKEIVERDWILLGQALPNYRDQILKAVKRKDQFSILHRSTAFLETYFDLIFACNGLSHPGEKRLIPLIRQKCPILPDHFEENLEVFFKDLYGNSQRTEKNIDAILFELNRMLKFQGLLK